MITTIKKIAIMHIEIFSKIVRFDKGTLNDVPKQAQLIISSFLLNFINIPYVWGSNISNVKILEKSRNTPKIKNIPSDNSINGYIKPNL